jgi:dihydroorotate dehydrogenase (NAD+) catalytic subunit
VKARRRVVTSSGPIKPLRRTPTVRRLKPAIMPIDHSKARPALIRPVEAAPEPEAATGVDVELSVDLGRGLVLANPIVAASGPFGYGVEVADVVELARIGAIVTRSTTLRVRPGNTSVRPGILEVHGGILSAVGLPNPGIDTVLERYAATWARWHVPVILSVAGGSAGEVVEVLKRLEGEPGIAGIELHLQEAGSAGSFVAAARRATDLPLIVKLAPETSDHRAAARSAAEAGADAIAAIGGIPAFDPAIGQALLTGPAIRPIGLRAVFEIAGAVEVPIIGIGGVTSLGDILAYLAAGASAVGVGTAALAEPALLARLAAELRAHCAREGITSAGQLVGTARQWKPRRDR